MDKFVFPFKDKLARTSLEVAGSNTVNNFIPIRTKENEFNWNVVIGLVLSSMLRKKIEKFSYEEFEKECKKSFELKLSNKYFWLKLKEMYFENDALFSLSPEMYLFKSQKSEYKKSDERIASMFINLLQGEKVNSFDTKLNFIENEILNVLISQMENESQDVKEEPYLPFLSEMFKKDIRFLAKHPKYLLSSFESFLKFYGFIYISQLSLSISDWKTAEQPLPKPLFFIMEHEKASGERIHVRNHGYKLFEDNSRKLFPYLAMLEQLQPELDKLDNGLKVPLWSLARAIKESQNASICSRLEEFAKAFKSNRKLDLELYPSSNAFDWIEQLLNLSMEQFTNPTSGKKGIHIKHANQIEVCLADGFFKSRGRAGRVLILNPEYLLLLANLAIGDREQLRFQELVGEFKSRGVFLDKQTEIELIKFFERIGNVEKMSDSGDAVYVRKTI